MLSCARRTDSGGRGGKEFGLFLEGGHSEPGAGLRSSRDDGDGVVNDAFGQMRDVVAEAAQQVWVRRERVPVLVLVVMVGTTLPGTGGHEARGDEVVGEPGGVPADGEAVGLKAERDLPC